MSTLQILWIVWMVEVSAILVCFFFVGARNLGEIIGAIALPPIGLGTITGVMFWFGRKFPKYFTGRRFVLQFFPGWERFLGKAVWWTPLVGAGIVGLVILYRRLNPAVTQDRMSGSSREEKFRKINYDPERYFPRVGLDDRSLIKKIKDFFVRSGMPVKKKEDQYFIGLNDRKKPVMVSQDDLTMHMQVVGPSGTGKTVFLLSLVAQAIKKGVPVIFVDGKGDAGLMRKMGNLCPDLKLFCPILPDISETYNPFFASQDANELTNMLTVGMNIKQEGAAEYYTDAQKKFLGILLRIFVATGKKFNFEDVVEFLDHKEVRDSFVYPLVKDSFYIEEMKTFFEKQSQNEKELGGLSNNIGRLFVTDEEISKIINVYNSEISIQDIFENGGVALFSFSAGTKAETNEALAKMVLGDISNAVGKRQSRFGDNKFALVFLDEFGQYVSDYFPKFIATARSSNVGCILSHQSNAQLTTYYSGDNLAQVVRENTMSKVIFRQFEEAPFWAECLGTKESIKRTQQVETDALRADRISEMGTLRQVDEFKIHPNVFKNLQKGQAVWKSGPNEPEILNFGLLPLEGQGDFVKKEKRNKGEGLNLREKRLKQKGDGGSDQVKI